MSEHWVVTREADDPIANRLSIGNPHGLKVEDAGYIVYRGETAECITLLETALEKLKEHYAEQGE